MWNFIKTGTIINFLILVHKYECVRDQTLFALTEYLSHYLYKTITLILNGLSLHA